MQKNYFYYENKHKYFYSCDNNNVCLCIILKNFLGIKKDERKKKRQCQYKFIANFSTMNVQKISSKGYKMMRMKIKSLIFQFFHKRKESEMNALGF